ATHPPNLPIPVANSPFNAYLFLSIAYGGKIRKIGELHHTMSTQTVEPRIQPSANLVQIGSVEDIIQSRLAEERARLEREAGVARREAHHFKRPAERPFTRAQRAGT